MAAMVHGHGGPRWGPPSTWPRAVAALALFLAVTVTSAFALRAVATAPQLARAPGVATPETGGTPQEALGLGGELGPPAPSAQLAARPPDPRQAIGPHVTIPVLLYHYVRVNPVATDEVGFNLSVTPVHFAQQMAFLHATGAHVLSLADAMRHIQDGTPLPPRSVILTFDDGYKDFAAVAAPTMQKYGFHGTVFVVTGFVGRQGYMNADQVRRVDAMGMTIGCHTVHHVDLAVLPPDMARAEIQASHRQLDSLIGHPVLDFAYPYGYYSPAVERMVAADGFRDAVTTEEGIVLPLARPYAWPRLRIGGGDSVDSFARKAYAALPAGEVDQLVHSFEASPAMAAAQPSYLGPVADLDTAGGVDSRRYA